MPDAHQRLIIKLNLGEAAGNAVEPSKQVGFAPLTMGTSPDTMQPAGQTLVEGYRSRPAPKPKAPGSR